MKRKGVGRVGGAAGNTEKKNKGEHRHGSHRNTNQDARES